MKRSPAGQYKRSRVVRRSKRPLLWLAIAAAIALPTLAFVDTNDNGMSDIWEEQYNNGYLFPPGIDPQADADGDGWSNARESVAGTDPFSPNPPSGYLSPQLARIPAVFVIPSGGGDPIIETPEALALTWPTVPGKHYTLQFSPDLQITSWLAVETGFIGNGTEVTYTFALEAQDKLFWRVAVTDVDSDNDGLNNAEEHALGSNPANADSDSDGITDAVEQAQGTNPNNPDTDGDLTNDSEDADPLDGAIPWKKIPECSYVVVELGKPPFDPSPEIPYLTEYRYSALGEGGHVVMSRDRTEYWYEEQGWSVNGAAGPEYYETYVWSPDTSTWAGPLGLPANIRGCGSVIDIQGNVYGSGYGAIDANNTPAEQNMPGSKPVSLRWEKATAGWNPATAEEALGLIQGFTNDHGTMLQTPGMIKCDPCLFGASGHIISQSAGGGTSSAQEAKLLRLGTVDTTPICTASSDGSGNSVQIADLQIAGEPSGWHAATWSKITTDAYTQSSQSIPEFKFARLMANGQVSDNTAPAGDACWNLRSLAAINSNHLPTGIHDIVIWSTMDGSFQVGTRPEESGALTWKTSTQPDAAKRIGGKINSRGEGLAATKLWRNGKWQLLDELVDNTKWTNVHGVDINSTGTILCTANKSGAGANGVDTPVLLVPVGFIKMWETKNKANQIIVKAKRDDPKDSLQVADADGNLYGTPRNMLYVTADPMDSKYHVSLDCLLGGQRNQFVCAAYIGDSKINDTDKVFPVSADLPADMLIPASGTSQVGENLVIKLAFDANKNGLIDSNEPPIVLTAITSEAGLSVAPMIRGFSLTSVNAANLAIHGQATGTGLTGWWKPNAAGEWFVPNAIALLRMFYDGGISGMNPDYMPTLPPDTESLSAFGSPGDFNEWLTHHSGACFNTGGISNLPVYYWDSTERISKLIANSSPLRLLTNNPTITAQMASETNTTVEYYKQASVPIGQTQLLPSTVDGHDLQPVLAGLGAPHSSPAWVPNQTILVGDQDGYEGIIPDDAFGTVGRSRFINGEYRFIVKKEQREQMVSSMIEPGVWSYELIPYRAVVIYLRISGTSQDLYDFNHNAGGLSIPAAITQISYGNGGYGRTNGQIFRTTVDILEDYEIKEIRLP